MSSQAVPLIWIIILNWNGLEDTLACLESLQQLDTSGLLVETLVIDNGSRDDPSRAIHERFPGITTVRFEKNCGFAQGCNYGISLAMDAQATHILLLNNDTFVDPAFLKHLVAAMNEHPEMGIVAPIICATDDRERVTFAGARLVLALGYFEHCYQNRRRSHVPQAPISSDYVTGCCMLIARHVIERVGMLESRYFAYFEDVEYGIRARRHGFKLACIPQSIIWHNESASTRRDLQEGTTSPLKHYLLARNRIATVIRYANIFELSSFFLVSNTSVILFYLCAFFIRRRWKKMIAVTLGMLHGIQGHFDHPAL